MIIIFFLKKKKRLKLLQRPLAVLKVPIIYFPPKAPQKAREHHLPHESILSSTTSPLDSKQINHLTRHNSGHPKAIGKGIP
jgi:hypothetical protein